MISLSFEYISRTQFLVSDFCVPVYKFSSLPLPSVTMELVTFFQGPVVTPEEIAPYSISSSSQALVRPHSLPSSWTVLSCCYLFFGSPSSYLFWFYRICVSVYGTRCYISFSSFLSSFGPSIDIVLRYRFLSSFGRLPLFRIVLRYRFLSSFCHLWYTLLRLFFKFPFLRSEVATYPDPVQTRDALLTKFTFESTVPYRTVP